MNGIWLSFTNTSLISQERDFVGFANYVQLWGDPRFWNAWGHTLWFTFASTSLETLIGLAMALILYETFSGRGWVRAAMLVPWAMPTVVTSKMFGWLFDGQHGIINYILLQLGLIDANINWYGSPDTAMTTIIIADVWKTTPFMALLLLTGLQTVPKSLIEAARMDGAKAWTIFWYIRLPLLMPTLLIAGLFRALDAFRIFDLVYVLTGGGPGRFHRDAVDALLQGALRDASVRLRLDRLHGDVRDRGHHRARLLHLHHAPDPEGGMNETRPPLQMAALYLGAILILIWSGGPFLWQFSTSFQLDRELTSGSPSLIPDPFTLEHYWNAFVEKQLHRYIWNSLVVALGTTFLCLFVGSLAAFALSRLDIKGRFGILIVILSVSMFPQIALVGPLYLIAANLGLLDTYTALIITYLALGLPLVTWVLFGYFETLPREIDEAARMDGVRLVGLLWHIILPMSLPSLVTTGLLAFITAWNEFLFALAFTSDINTQTIPVGIANFTNLYYVPWGDIAAASAVVTVPLIVLVLVFQRHIIEGLTQGGIKE